MSLEQRIVKDTGNRKLHFIIVHTCEKGRGTRQELCGSGSNTGTGTGCLAWLLELIWRGNYAMLKWILTGQAEEEAEGREEGERGKTGVKKEERERAEGTEGERE